jgi:SAM-dependent methyltransferase
MDHKPKKHKLMAGLVVGKRVLDIGFAQYPNPFLKNPIGVDVQEKEKPRNYKEIYKINLNKENLPFRDNSFDSIIAGEVMEHVENPSFLLREINRVLENNGKLIISTPHGCYYWEIIRNLFFSSIKSIDEGEHLSNWNILDFERLLRKNGFEVKKKYGSVLTLPPPLRWRIPVKRFPKLSWIVIYECIKKKKADDRIYTRGSKGIYGSLTKDVIKINNENYNK